MKFKLGKIIYYFSCYKQLKYWKAPVLQLKNYTVQHQGSHLVVDILCGLHLPVPQPTFLTGMISRNRKKLKMMLHLPEHFGHDSSQVGEIGYIIAVRSSTRFFKMLPIFSQTMRSGELRLATLKHLLFESHTPQECRLLYSQVEFTQYNYNKMKNLDKYLF